MESLNVSNTKSLLLVALLSLLALPALAAPPKVAILDVQRAIMETDDVKKTLRDLKNDSTYRTNMRSAEKIKQEGQTLVEKLRKDGPVMSKDQQAKLQGEIQAKQGELEQVARKVQAQEQQILKPIVDRKQTTMQAVVKDLIKKEKIGLLLDSRGAIHADPDFDITAEVTKLLNQTP
jgi:outer membrane protein